MPYSRIRFLRLTSLDTEWALLAQFKGVLALEPLSGITTLMYTLPFGFGVSPGDVQVFDPSPSGNGDLLRFEGSTQLFVFSDTPDGSDSLADVGLPNVVNPSGIDWSVTELGLEGNNSAIYAPSEPEPSPGQPGFSAGQTIQYTFVSDGAVPEPSTWILLAFGGILLLLWQIRFKRA